MNIFNLIGGNWLRGPQTQRFPERQAPLPGYRGCVIMDPDKCIACGVCAHVCVSAAIRLDLEEDHCDWTYDPARCTFCGVCATYCPVDALTQAGDRGESCARPGDQAETVSVPYPTCPECGKPAMPFSEALLGEAFGAVSAELRERAHLCEECRQKETIQAMKDVLDKTSDAERNDHGR